MKDERSFYIFLFLPWKKMFPVKISFVFHGRRASFLHFLASPAGEEYSFLILLSSPVGDRRSFLFYYLRPWATGFLFLFSINPMLQRRSFSCFFSMGLLSNAHRVERSTNFLIMEKCKSCCRLRPYRGCSCPACESIARRSQRITAASLPSMSGLPAGWHRIAPG